MHKEKGREGKGEGEREGRNRSFYFRTIFLLNTTRSFIYSRIYAVHLITFTEYLLQVREKEKSKHLLNTASLGLPVLFPWGFDQGILSVRNSIVPFSLHTVLFQEIILNTIHLCKA